jgi:hypothetical protein
MKVCTKCGEKKPLTEFHKSKRSQDGRGCVCDKCSQAKSREYRDKNRERLREYDRVRSQTKARKADKNVTSQRWQKKNTLKTIAHRIVNEAIRKGSLIRQPCCVCHNTESHAHHEDYSKPLDIIWLCATHHSKLHADRKRTARGLAPLPGGAVVVKLGSTTAAPLGAI